MKPVGLEDPKTGKTPYAVVQLRQDDAAGTFIQYRRFPNSFKVGTAKEVLQLIPDWKMQRLYVMV